MQTLKPTIALGWRNQQPYSAQFDDVYFSSDNGLLESEYVFLQGNRLAERWHAQQSPKFTIIETGFGTGLNFLSCSKLWLETPLPHCELHFISVEKYPLSLNDIAAALNLWPELTAYRQAFLKGYPEAVNDKSVLIFDKRIRFTLLIGDAAEQLKTLNIQADAWFLDGFAPSKNPEMWQPNLFNQMALLSHTQTTFATFTSAGEVRRSLIAAGFNVQKIPGFGKKREMLVGQYVGNPS